jgi:hypothetical protein
MKIAILSNKSKPLGDPLGEDFEKFIVLLINGLNEEQNNLSVFASINSILDIQFHPLNSDAIDWGFQQDCNLEFKNFIDHQHAYSEALNFIQDQDHDLILNFTDHPWPILNGRFLNTPLITVLNTPPTAALQSAVKLNQHKGIYFICSSYYLQSIWAPHSQISEVIPSGIDVNLHSFSNVTEENRAIWMGDIERGTGLEDALLACKQNYWNLCIIGEIKDQKYLDYIIEPYLDEETFILDPEKDSLTCENYLKRAEVALFTQEKYNTAELILKCLAYGMPVATYPMNSLKEFLPEGIGKQTTAENIAELAHIGKTVLKNPRRNCRGFVEEHFASQKQAKYFSEFINKIVQSEQSKKENAKKLVQKKSLP